MTNTTEKLSDAMQRVTDAVIEAMEKHGTNWVKPWSNTGAAKAITGMPTNAVSGREYRGINIWLLAFSGHATPHWATFKQWQSVGAKIIKGQRSTAVYFWKPLVIKDKESGEDKTIWITKSYNVFNADQVEGWEAPTVDAPAPVVVEGETFDHPDLEAFFAATGVKTRVETSAYYSPSGDYVAMPAKASFKGTATSTPAEAYYSTYAHEMAHWTGGSKRLNRDQSGRFGDPKYAFEELVAELTAVFVSIRFGLSPAPRADHAQYLNNWLSALKNDKRLIMTAASKAQAALDHLHSYSSAVAVEDEEVAEAA